MTLDEKIKKLLQYWGQRGTAKQIEKAKKTAIVINIDLMLKARGLV